MLVLSRPIYTPFSCFFGRLVVVLMSRITGGKSLVQKKMWVLRHIADSNVAVLIPPTMQGEYQKSTLKPPNSRWKVLKAN